MPQGESTAYPPHAHCSLNIPDHLECSLSPFILSLCTVRTLCLNPCLSYSHSASMTVLFQNSFYIGNTFNGILYGVELMLCLLTAEAMAKKRRAHRARSDLLLMTFNGASLLLNTIYVATEAVFGQEMWIEKASYSGGQDAYLRDHESVWYQTLGTSASIVLNLLSEALMIHRCNVIWGDVRAIIGPCILYLATLCESLMPVVRHPN
ncbi:hypothetical protein GSI_03240 [Ganoderma sinense ZZ0214-1]|uniref:Uncharacterized protein n=1 Tax=Ganoderma sinense ZZ0214-1 TaxID=1077348 RepID=A0A2G8SL24_9APHY|nr:hypothetical protein GSI_03240 [Ganoderma sinense ZZ0214-1]